MNSNDEFTHSLAQLHLDMELNIFIYFIHCSAKKTITHIGLKLKHFPTE